MRSTPPRPATEPEHENQANEMIQKYKDFLMRLREIDSEKNWLTVNCLV